MQKIGLFLFSNVAFTKQPGCYCQDYFGEISIAAAVILLWSCCNFGVKDHWFRLITLPSAVSHQLL